MRARVMELIEKKFEYYLSGRILLKNNEATCDL